MTCAVANTLINEDSSLFFQTVISYQCL